MNIETLQRILLDLNHNREFTYISYPLSETVEYALIWVDITTRVNNTVSTIKSKEIVYLIKMHPQSNKYIGAVLDMKNRGNGEDLHAYLLENYRGDGHMFESLKKIILPHILRNSKSKRITITENDIGSHNYGKSVSLALKCGFQQISENEFVIEKDKVEEFVDSKSNYITEEQLIQIIHELRKKLIEIEIINERLKSHNLISSSLNQTLSEFNKIIEGKLKDEYRNENPASNIE